ncbi:class I SAM-dependent methyltransferase [Asanoa iriomotensis]|uniref:class I SAM-dependent methyltransferase n=1 Tax=Asanoa iriomotensis TaxID=234613 RepID=UPI0031E09040
MSDRLLSDETLAGSAVVANSAMNRERQLAGPNSYTRDLGFNPLDRLLETADGPVAWLDLCCGQGRALLQAGAEVTARGLAGRVELVGVDLVDYFDPVPPGSTVTLICAAAAAWQPERRFDLITVVHGLHYVGDKLGVLARAASWLTATGLLVADLDLTSIRRADGRPLGRTLTARLTDAGFTYDGRRRRITRVGRGELTLPYTFLGADDRAGPNYTGQPAVHSYYSPAALRE